MQAYRPIYVPWTGVVPVWREDYGRAVGGDRCGKLYECEELSVTDDGLRLIIDSSGSGE
jgi:hypothetical protein